ncbi:MAG: hypothetical protein R3C03_05960 [Pirellulaceae bacterium]
MESGKSANNETLGVAENGKPKLTGSEMVFSIFNQAQVTVNGLRMTIDGRMVQQVSDLASQLEITRREFQHYADPFKAIGDVQRVNSTLQQRAQAWEQQAQGRERNTIGMAGNALKKMREEHSQVRRNVSNVSRLMTKLEVDLNSMAGEWGLTEGEPQTSIENANVNGQDMNSNLSTDHSEIETSVLAALNLIFESPISVSYASANRKVDDEAESREQAWDMGTGMILVLRWVPILDSQWMSSYVFLWLIPKFDEMAASIREHCNDLKFRISSDQNSHTIGINPREPVGTSSPKNKKISLFAAETRRISFESNPDSQYSCYMGHSVLSEPLETKYTLELLRRENEAV